MAGCDHVAILVPEVAALAGVRIQAADRDARPRDAPEPAHVVVQDAAAWCRAARA